MKKLSGKTAIVTGANQGLGKAIATAFAEAGANLVICARNEKLLREVEDELNALISKPCESIPKEVESGSKEKKSGALATAVSHQSILAIQADIANKDQVSKLVDTAVARFKKIDILVNNAGVYGPIGPSEDVDWDDWVSAIEINLFGTMLMCRKILPHFKANKYGKVINISGGGATNPLPRFSAYAASKAAVVRLTETLAHECQNDGIDINAIAPGALNTRLLDEVLAAGPEKAGEDFYARSLKQRDEGGAGLERGASLCTFLASSDSDGITGRLISALWDPWKNLPEYSADLKKSDIYTLRRITPEDRGKKWGDK